VRTRVEFRLPADEKAALYATARENGITVSANLRILAIEDRERQERAELRAKCYPERPTGSN
jgi:hypothetical protein